MERVERIVIYDSAGPAQCGPHCGTKDQVARHCNGCHQRVTHGNAMWVARSDWSGRGHPERWVVR